MKQTQGGTAALLPLSALVAGDKRETSAVLYDMQLAECFHFKPTLIKFMVN